MGLERDLGPYRETPLMTVQDVEASDEDAAGLWVCGYAGITKCQS